MQFKQGGDNGKKELICAVFDFGVNSFKLFIVLTLSLFMRVFVLL